MEKRIRTEKDSILVNLNTNIIPISQQFDTEGQLEIEVLCEGYESEKWSFSINKTTMLDWNNDSISRRNIKRVASLIFLFFPDTLLS